MTTKKTATEVPAEVEATVEATPILSYVGPSIPDMGLQRYQHFIGGYPQSFNDAPDTVKTVLRRLFVPVSQLAKVMADVEVAGTAYNTWYKEAFAALRTNTKEV